MHQRISNLIIERDCLLVVNELQQLEAPCSTVGNMLLDIKELMATSKNAVSNMVIE